MPRQAAYGKCIRRVTRRLQGQCIHCGLAQRLGLLYPGWMDTRANEHRTHIPEAG